MWFEEKILTDNHYRLDTANSNTVKSNLHLIQTFAKSLPNSYLFNVKMYC